MPNTRYVPREPDEPRGKPYDEPRPDHLHLSDSGEYWLNDRGQRVCGAKRHGFKNHGKRCSQTGIKDNGRCHQHGGSSPAGRAHPSYKTGRHSKYLPKDLRERYEHFAQDEEIVHLRDELALLDTRISELMEAANLGASVNLFKRLRTEYDQMNEARDRAQQAREDENEATRRAAMQEVARRLERIGQLIHRLDNNAEVWDDVVELVKERRKTARAELQRIVKSEQVVNVEEAVTIMNTLADTVQKLIDMHVPKDQQQKARSYMHQNTNAIFGGRSSAQA